MPVLFYVFWIAVLTASMTLASDATRKPEYAKNRSARGHRANPPAENGFAQMQDHPEER